ncbi:hypothetical protein JCM5296_003346 [Sporobolomyces johnsonii]
MAPKQGSVEVGHEPAQGEGRIRRCFASPDELVTSPAPHIKVVADVLVHAVDKYADVDALGWRDITDVVKEEKEVKKARSPFLRATREVELTFIGISTLLFP